MLWSTIKDILIYIRISLIVLWSIMTFCHLLRYRKSQSNIIAKI